MIGFSIALMRTMPLQQITNPLIQLRKMSKVLYNNEQKQRELILYGVDILNDLKKKIETLHSEDINEYKDSIKNIKPWISDLSQSSLFQDEDDLKENRELLEKLKEIMNTAVDNMKQDINEKLSLTDLASKISKLLKNTAEDMNDILFTRKKIDENILTIEICIQMDQFLINKSVDRNILFGKTIQEIRSWLYAEGFEIN